MAALSFCCLIPSAAGQVRAQKRIGTAEEFLSPTYHRYATNAIGGLTDVGDVYAYTAYDLPPGGTGITALAWRWTLDDGAIYTTPSATYSTPLSAHDQTPYPYANARQHGIGFYSVEPGGQALAFSSDDRTESPGVTGPLSMDPITTSRTTVWTGGPTGWLSFVNNPASASNGLEFDLETHDYDRIYPGGNILGNSRRQHAKVVNYASNGSYWEWQALSPVQLVDFLLPSAVGTRQYYAGPSGYPDDRLIEADINRTGKTVGLAMRLLPDNSGKLEWKGVYWPVPGSPFLIDQIIGIQAYPQHITAAGEICGVLPSLTGGVGGEGNLRDGRLFVWLPKAKWGLPAGLNWLSPAGSQAQFICANDRGLLFYQITSPAGSTVYYQWSSGSLRQWSFTSTTWSTLIPIGPVNNKGAVVCVGQRVDDGTDDYVLSYPVIDVDLTVEPKEVEVGDEFELVATVQSRSQYDVLGFGQTAVPEISGDRNATINGTPTPTAPRTLPAGGTMTYRWRCRATHSGEARFSAELKGTPSNDATTVYRTLNMTSDAVTIKKPEIIVNLATDEGDADVSDECADIDLQKTGRQTTLRSALQYAATTPAADRVIKFDIPGGTARSVKIQSPLPQLPDECEINGKNPSGSITGIDGSLLARGLTLLTGQSKSKVRNLAFNSQPLRNNTGLYFLGPDNEVTGCRFGQNEDGEPISLDIAIRCETGPQHLGGTGVGDGNEFLDGTSGIILQRADLGVIHGIVIEGNHFGRSSLSSKSGPDNGIFLGNVADSRIGGLTVSARNYFIGCGNAGIVLVGPGAAGNDIQGNWFGLKDDGNLPDLAAFNGNGIGLGFGAHHNRIGGSGDSARNIISGSEECGVVVTLGAHDNIISGNWIGLNNSGVGEGASNNGVGIQLLAGYSNRIGGSGTGERNVISDNRLTAIQVGRDPRQTYKDPVQNPGNEICLDTSIQGNWIGTDRSGAQPVPNGRSWNGGGSAIQVLNFASGTVIGGEVLSKRNVISGNFGTGIAIAGDTGTTTAILGNRIGTAVDGLSGIPNQQAGIVLQGSSSITIGGLNPGQGNEIAYNKGPGIDFTRMKAPAPGVILAGNLIYDNGSSKSIVLASGHTANDEGDGDSGPNGLQNWPIPVAAVNQASNTLIAFDLSSFARGVQVRVDAYAASGGGGKSIIGTKSVITGSDPADRYVITGTLQFAGAPITLMATTQDGSSEFSPSFKVVSGLDSDGDGLPDALERQVPITSGNGPRGVPTLGDRNGDTIADETQANVASIQVPDEGAWITIVAPAGFPITGVTGLRNIDVPSLPAENMVQPGAVRFTLGGNTGISQPMTLIVPSWAESTKIWLRNGAAWQELTGVVVQPTGSLTALAFTLPPRAPGSLWLLAIGHAIPNLPLPTLTLLPPQLRPVERGIPTSSLNLTGEGGAADPPVLDLVQPLTVSRPPGSSLWTLQTSSDMMEWENIPSPDPAAAEYQLTWPLNAGSRFFRWFVP
ncbi:hypothetical protein [Haloferula sp. BvORR071]|uniref:hypothetical protein n=1 Tax=Haloferula sp. BvORR071 TaxID=1396141 RepID=UPI0005599CD4|nr:hypothetical protein [Haloferula sp. BvORR071]